MVYMGVNTYYGWTVPEAPLTMTFLSFSLSLFLTAEYWQWLYADRKAQEKGDIFAKKD